MSRRKLANRFHSEARANHKLLSGIVGLEKYIISCTNERPSTILLCALDRLHLFFPSVIILKLLMLNLTPYVVVLVAKSCPALL